MIRPLKLDFIAQPTPLRYAGFFLLVVAVVLAVCLGQLYYKRSVELANWEVKWRSLQSAQQRKETLLPKQGPEWERMQGELKLANQVIGHLAMPWDSLFHEIESSVDGQVSLLSIEPDTEKRELRINAEAKSLQAMLEYVARLRTVKLFKDAHIVSHQIQITDPQRPVRFEVNMHWGESS